MKHNENADLVTFDSAHIIHFFDLACKSHESHMKVVCSKSFSNASRLGVIGFWPCRPPSQTTPSAGPLQCLRQYQPQLSLNDFEKNVKDPE